MITLSFASRHVNSGRTAVRTLLARRGWNRTRTQQKMLLCMVHDALRPIITLLTMGIAYQSVRGALIETSEIVALSAISASAAQQRA
jgi:hypothetical protein